MSKPQQKWSSSVCLFGAVEKLSPEPVHIYVYAQVPPPLARKTHWQIVSCRVCVCAHSLERRRPDKKKSPTNQRGRQQRLQRDAKASPQRKRRLEIALQVKSARSQVEIEEMSKLGIMITKWKYNRNPSIGLRSNDIELGLRRGEFISKYDPSDFTRAPMVPP